MSGVITRRSANFVETEIDDEAVVMSLDGGEFFSLKDSALAIWQAIDGTRTRDDVIALLAADYDVAPSAIADDVDAFLAQVRAAGLIGEA